MNDLLTVCEVAAILRVDERTVRMYLTAKKLFGQRLPHKNGYGEWRIPRDAIDCLLAGREYQAQAHQGTP